MDILNQKEKLVLQWNELNSQMRRAQDAFERAHDQWEEDIIPSPAAYEYVKRQVGLAVQHADEALGIVDEMRLDLLDVWADRRKADEMSSGR